MGLLPPEPEKGATNFMLDLLGVDQTGRSVWKESGKVTKTPRETYKEAIEQVWKIYEEARDKAKKPYDEAVAQAVEIREEAKKQAWATCHEAEKK